MDVAAHVQDDVGDVQEGMACPPGEIDVFWINQGGVKGETPERDSTDYGSSTNQS